MLKDIFISPQVFTEPTVNPDSWKDIKYLLENILNSGYIIGLKRKRWIKETKSNISKLEPKAKGYLLKLITTMNDRERIVDHPILESDFEGEADWLNLALKLHEKRHLHSIFSTHTQGNVLSPECLEDMNITAEYGVSGSQKFLLSSENIKKILTPFLSYAKKLTIIDPFFYIHNSGTERSLRIIAKILSERRGERQPGSIVVNCRDSDKEILPRQKWRKILLDINKETGQAIGINIWKQKYDSIKMHDRYLITNQSGLVSAAGTDINDFKESEWSIKDHGELQEILAKYKSNSSPFELIDSFSTE